MNSSAVVCLLVVLCMLVHADESHVLERDSSGYRSRAVVVTGTRAETPLEYAPVRVEVVSGEQMRGTAISTVAELLREQAGVLLSPGAVRPGVQLMGLSPDYTLVLVDGQPLTGRVGGVIDLGRVTTSNVERVEIVRGPLSSLYGGDALAGVINIITRRPEAGAQGRMLARYLYRGSSELQAEQGYSSEHWEWTLTGVARYAAPFELARDSMHFAYPSAEDYTLSGKVQWKPVERVRTQLWGRLFGGTTRGNLVQAQAGQIATVAGTLRMLDGSLATGAEWMSPIGRLSLQLYGTAYREGYTFSGDSTDSFLRRTGRAYLQYDRLINLRNRVMAGVEFLYDDAGGSRYPEHPFYRTVAAFAQWEGHPVERLSYALSLRADWTSAFGMPRSVLLGNAPLLPRLSIRYALSQHVALSATIGEGFKAPDMRQLYIRFSPAGAGYQLLGARMLGLNLQPEQVLTAMTGATVTFDTLRLGQLQLRRTLFDVLLFFNRLRNMIEYYAYSQSPLVFTYHNVAAVQTYGVLVSTATQLQRSDEELLALQAAYQWLAAYDERVLDAIDRGSAGYLIPSTGEYHRLTRSQYLGLWYRPFHSAWLRVDYRYQPWRASLNVRVQYVGSFGDLQRAVNPDVFAGSTYLGQLLDDPRELVPASWIVNLGVVKDIPLGATVLQVAAGVNNVFDVADPRSMPWLVGRQGFCSIQLEW